MANIILHTVQNRHMVLCRTIHFFCICIFPCTFSYDHTLLAYDMLQMRLGDHSIKVQNFCQTSSILKLQDLVARSKNVLLEAIECWQDIFKRSTSLSKKDLSCCIDILCVECRAVENNQKSFNLSKVIISH